MIVAGTWLTMSAGGCVAEIPIINVREWRAQSRGDMIADALELYREREGKYPTALELLTPKDMVVVPTTGLRVFSSDPFDYGMRESGEYQLTYYGAFMTTCSRDVRRFWTCVD